MRDAGRAGRAVGVVGAPSRAGVREVSEHAGTGAEEEADRQGAAREAEDVEVEVDAAPSKQAEALKEELDDLLDEIDSVLESNAEDFVRSYVQKGGE